MGMRLAPFWGVPRADGRTRALDLLMANGR
jgi:hypothetical protein